MIYRFVQPTLLNSKEISLVDFGWKMLHIAVAYAEIDFADFYVGSGEKHRFNLQIVEVVTQNGRVAEDGTYQNDQDITA